MYTHVITAARGSTHILMISVLMYPMQLCFTYNFIFIFLFCRHAGVYTAEEVALIMRDKLIRLQSLYIDQFKRLQHVMKEKRRKYLQTSKQEREALGTVCCKLLDKVGINICGFRKKIVEKRSRFHNSYVQCFPQAVFAQQYPHTLKIPCQASCHACQF